MTCEVYLDGWWMATIDTKEAMAMQPGDALTLPDKRRMFPGSAPEMVKCELMERRWWVTGTGSILTLHCRSAP